uniref:Uncharacterized protein n=1 Tax=Fusarium oxysporum (strain Fo5176) TaxID=660025 RepID=A0A0D2XAZ1_FUSOF
MGSSRQRELRPEDSWRFVEGENDSFDTSILPSLGESSPPTSSGNIPSQPFSQGNLSFASQDSIRDFGADPDDEQVILREPFRPSLSRASVSANGERVFRSPDPEFHMPRIDTASEGSSRSERTIRGLGIEYGGNEVPAGGDGLPVEFDDLMNVQSKFEQVLEKSSDGVSLPFEMKRSETAIRDLRSLVRHSDLQARDELLFEFDGYIDTARQTSSDLQKFNTHVGSAVDAVISINRWTSRYLDTLSPETDDGKSISSPSPILGWASWLFHPFQPTTDHIFNERVLLDKYIEHTALVSDRIATLILEAQAVLRLLTKAEDHLMLIYDISSRSSADTASRRENVLWNIWTLVGANSNQLNSLSRQLALLRQVDAQRSSAVAQVNALILELESIQAGLGDLRDRVAEPEVLRNGIGSGPPIPLSVHIETIDRGVERLEDARSRIRAAENDRVRDALARGGVRNEPLLEGKGKRGEGN